MPQIVSPHHTEPKSARNRVTASAIIITNPASVNFVKKVVETLLNHTSESGRATVSVHLADPNPKTPMNSAASSPGLKYYHAPTRLLALLAHLAGLSMALPAFAQETSGSDDIVEFSPFEVSASSDNGYVATETLSGTRLRTLLSETPASISEITAELMDDIGATDMESIAQFLPSTEVYTTLGTDIFGDSTKAGDNFSVRGLRTNTRMRNFFRTESFGDRYITERVSFARGPNAILFGIGDPSGSVQIGTNRAAFGPSRGSAVLQFDNLNSIRSELHQNFHLIKNRFSVRFDGLLDRKNGFRDPTHDDKDGVYVAATWRPFKKSNSTTIRANYEYGTIDRVAARPWAPFNKFSTWVDQGTPLYDNIASAPTSTGLALLNNNYFINIRGQDSVELLRATRRTTGTAPNRYYGAARSTGVFINGQESDINVASSITADFVAINPLDTLLNHFGGDQTKVDAYLASLGANRKYLDSWAGQTLVVPRETFFSGGVDNYTQRFDGFSTFIEHQFSRDLFLEIAGNWERSKTQGLNMLRSTDYAIYYDPNLYLPQTTASTPVPAATAVAQPNPFVGMPYVEQAAFPVWNDNNIRSSEYRATLSYNLDLTKKSSLLRFLGRHRLTAFYNYYDRTSESVQLRGAITRWNGLSSATGATGIRAATWASHSRYYLMPGENPYFPDDGFPLVGDPAMVAGDWYNFQGNYLRGKIASTSFSDHATLLNNRLILTAGMRRDRRKQDRSDAIYYDSTNFDDSIGNYLGELNLEATYQNITNRDDRVWNNKSRGAVLRIFKEKKGPIDYLNVFYNTSNNVSGDDNVYNIDWQPITPNSGSGMDKGIKFSLFGNRLQGSITRFETIQENAATNNNSITGRGAFLSSNIHDLIAQVLPNDPIIDREASSPATTWVNTYDSATKGMELEVTYNPTKNLRLRLTYSEQSNKYTNFGTDIASFYAYYRPILAKYVDDVNALGGAATPEQLATATSITTALPLWDDDLAQKLALNSGKNHGVPADQASLLVNYTFPAKGFLKGFTIGGSAVYRGRVTLGYETYADGSINEANAFVSDTSVRADLRLGYTIRLNRNFTLRTQLLVRNVLNNTDDLLQKAQWDRTTSSFVVQRNVMVEPRSYNLTSTLSW